MLEKFIGVAGEYRPVTDIDFVYLKQTLELVDQNSKAKFIEKMDELTVSTDYNFHHFEGGVRELLDQNETIKHTQTMMVYLCRKSSSLGSISPFAVKQLLVEFFDYVQPANRK